MARHWFGEPAGVTSLAGSSPVPSAGNIFYREPTQPRGSGSTETVRVLASDPSCENRARSSVFALFLPIFQPHFPCNLSKKGLV